MKVNDIIKMKYLGMKRKFKVLGPHDIIRSTDLHCKVLDENPLCYEKTLSKYNKGLKFLPTYCDGDSISDDHTCRIYLRPINNNEQ